MTIATEWTINSLLSSDLVPRVSHALALTYFLQTQTVKSISQLVLLGVNLKQPLSEVVYKKHCHVDFTAIGVTRRTS